MAYRKARPHLTILTIADLKVEAERRTPKLYSEYYNEGAGDLLTLQENEDAFRRYKLRPRVLRDVGDVDMSTNIFGCQVAAPCGYAPSGAHQLAHRDGELATSRAATANNIPMCLSSWSNYSLEDVIGAGGRNPYIMQVTFLTDVRVTQRVIKRAEKAGYKAIFVTVDLPMLGNRLSEARNDFAFPSSLDFPNLTLEQDYQTTKKNLDYDPTISWEKTMPVLRKLTKMEIWLKGVYTPEDVELAISHGVDGIIISNHGGRQLDGVASSLDALRECADAARGKIQIAMDGGIRRGSDVFKALALGAKFCFFGRPVVWGLAYNGEKGVDLATKIILEELRQTMAMCGCRKISDIKRSHLGVLGEKGLLSKL